MKDNPGQRRGQAAFNLMYEIFPISADDCRGSSIDPYQNDKVVEQFVDACLPAEGENV